VVTAHNVTLTASLFPGHGIGRPRGPVVIDRNVTVTSAFDASSGSTITGRPPSPSTPDPPTIDFSQLQGVVLLRAGAALAFSHVIVTRIHYGPGIGADFVRGEGSRSVVRFDDVIWRREICFSLDSIEGSTLISAARATAAGGGEAAAVGDADAVVAVVGNGTVSNSSGGGVSRTREVGEDSTSPAALARIRVRRQPVCLAGECYSNSLRLASARILIQQAANMELGQQGAGAGGGNSRRGAEVRNGAFL